MKPISQADAERAITLLIEALNDRRTNSERMDFEDRVSEFLFDDDGNERFADAPEYDGTDTCTCNTCPATGPFPCVRED